MHVHAAAYSMHATYSLVHTNVHSHREASSAEDVNTSNLVEHIKAGNSREVDMQVRLPCNHSQQ